MVAGEAVVASRVGGADVSALATVFACLASNSALRQTFSGAGRARAQGFDWSAVAAQHSSLYRATHA